jgi:hypothetical protein
MLAARVLSHAQASTSKAAASSPARKPQQQQQQQQPPQPAQPAPDPMLVTARLGAEAALKAVCERFGGAVFEQLPYLWQHMATALEAEAGPEGAPGGDPQALIHAIQVCGDGCAE